VKAARLLIFIYSNANFPPVSKLGRFTEFVTVTAHSTSKDLHNL